MNKSLKSIIEKMDKFKEESVVKFYDFLPLISKEPERHLRNVFQLLYDMLNFYIPPGINEYPDDPYFLDYLKYDCDEIFVNGLKHPFFADRLLINKLFATFKALKEKTIINRMVLFLGPCGSGKTVFLNSLLNKLESYTKLDQGAMFQTLWKYEGEKGLMSVTCPSHDHPIIQIPKEHRRSLLDNVIEDENFKDKLFNSKEYEWVFEKSPCVVCSGIFKALSKKLSTEEVLNTIYAKRYIYNRKISEGIAIHNPADKIDFDPMFDKDIQRRMNVSMESSTSEVPYIHSRQAKTNNGVYAIMDAKSRNIERIEMLHSLVSDGIQKVDVFEEEIDSVFLTLMNPENLTVVYEEESFSDRITEIQIPYVRDYKTEIRIYESIHGEGMYDKFLPGVLELFTKVIVCTRLNNGLEAIDKWILNKQTYKKLCDPEFKLLKADMYSGELPKWLQDSDIKKFDKNINQAMIKEGAGEGKIGCSGRESVEIFNNFFAKYCNSNDQITMDKVLLYFNSLSPSVTSVTFLVDIMHQYDYLVLQQIKESMFFYNDDRIEKDVMNYILAINNEVGSTITNPTTGETFLVDDTYFQDMEYIFLGFAYQSERETFRNNILKIYVSKTLQELKKGVPVKDTELFQELFKTYKSTIKEKVMAPFTSNANFRRALQEYGKESFKNYDKKITEKVEFLIMNLMEKFGYNEKGAVYIALYILDNNIFEEFD